MIIISFFLTLSIILAITFPYITPPLYISVIIIFQATIVAVSLWFISPSPWFSFLVIIVFSRGIIIIFAYISSLASNLLFKAPSFVIFTTLLIGAFIIKRMLDLFTKNPLTPNNSRLTETLTEKSILLTTPLYSIPLAPLSTFYIIYLLLSLLVTIHLTFSHEGPLRTTH